MKFSRGGVNVTQQIDFLDSSSLKVYVVPTRYSVLQILTSNLKSVYSQDFFCLLLVSDSLSYPPLTAQWWVRIQRIYVYFLTMVLGSGLTLSYGGGSAFYLLSEVGSGNSTSLFVSLFPSQQSSWSCCLEVFSTLERSWVSRLASLGPSLRGKCNGTPFFEATSLNSLFLSIRIISGCVSRQKGVPWFQLITRKIKVVFIVQSSLSRENQVFRAKSSKW